MVQLSLRESSSITPIWQLSKNFIKSSTAHNISTLLCKTWLQDQSRMPRGTRFMLKIAPARIWSACSESRAVGKATHHWRKMWSLNWKRNLELRWRSTSAGLWSMMTSKRYYRNTRANWCMSENTWVVSRICVIANRFKKWKRPSVTEWFSQDCSSSSKPTTTFKQRSTLPRFKFKRFARDKKTVLFMCASRTVPMNLMPSSFLNWTL